MEIRVYENVIRLDHVSGNGEHAVLMSEKATELVNKIRQRYPKVAMINDGEQFSSASEAFLRIWSTWVRAHGNEVTITACTSKAWVRAIAKTVSMLSGVDFKIFKNITETADFIHKSGFPDLKQATWETVWKLNEVPSAKVNR